MTALVARLVTRTSLAAAVLAFAACARSADVLPSWNEGAVKTSIVDFVARVTREGGPDVVPVNERIATFDNDGTLWAEQPLYVQAFFIFDRIAALAPQHSEWREQEPLRRA